jgi:predicted SprT family Zn-dependent metalloprotease
MPLTKTLEHGRIIFRLIRKWEKTWGLLGLSDTVTVNFNNRLRRSWGRSIPRLYRISLHFALLRDTSKLPLVLCHEVAHIAAYHHYGDRILPHGREWRHLVIQAGFIPQTKLHIPTKAVSGNKSLTAKLYEHTCPVCQFRRIAKRPCYSWRCRDCASAGLEGKMVISLLPS